jgi:hypothetical protein
VGAILSTDGGFALLVLRDNGSHDRRFHGGDTPGIQGDALSSTMARVLATIRATTRRRPYNLSAAGATFVVALIQATPR